jgi:hypothetical protein
MRLLLSPLASSRRVQAGSSGVEHYLDTVGVSGSNPLQPIGSMISTKRLSSGAHLLFNVSSRSVDRFYAETIHTLSNSVAAMPTAPPGARASWPFRNLNR